MHGRATSFISSVKVVFDPRKKINGGKTLEVWTKYPWPGLRAIPPPGMAVGLEIAAVLRRAEPARARVRPAHEHRGGGRPWRLSRLVIHSQRPGRSRTPRTGAGGA